MVKGRNGKHLLMHNGYTYYQHKILRDGFRWSCTQMGSRSCRGFLHVTKDNLVVRAQTEHTHQPSHYLLQNTKKQAAEAEKNTKNVPDQKNPKNVNPFSLKITSVQSKAEFKE